MDSGFVPVDRLVGAPVPVVGVLHDLGVDVGELLGTTLHRLLDGRVEPVRGRCRILNRSRKGSAGGAPCPYHSRSCASLRVLGKVVPAPAESGVDGLADELGLEREPSVGERRVLTRSM